MAKADIAAVLALVAALFIAISDAVQQRLAPARVNSVIAGLPLGSRAAVDVSWRPWFGGQWLQQRWIRKSFDPNQIPGLRFTATLKTFGSFSGSHCWSSGGALSPIWSDPSPEGC